MRERLFDAEYRAYCIARVAKARLTMQENLNITAERFKALRTPLPYNEFVKQEAPAQRYDLKVLEERKHKFLLRGQDRRQALLEAGMYKRLED